MPALLGSSISANTGGVGRGASGPPSKKGNPAEQHLQKQFENIGGKVNSLLGLLTKQELRSAPCNWDLVGAIFEWYTGGRPERVHGGLRAERLVC